MRNRPRAGPADVNYTKDMVPVRAGSTPGHAQRRSDALITPSFLPMDRNLLGFKGIPFSRTSKCRCGPVERPVEPTFAITWPFITTSPTLTRLLDRCA